MAHSQVGPNHAALAPQTPTPYHLAATAPMCYNPLTMADPSRDTSHIAINAHLLSGQSGYRSAGVHQYIYNLINHLGADGDDFRYSALVGSGELPHNPAVSQIRSGMDTEQAFARILWEQLAQPAALREIKADLVHGPVFVGPIVSPCPVVVTLHDLSFIRFPALFRRGNRLYLTVMTRLSAQRASRIIAVSAFTAKEAAALLGVPRERIDVVHNGVSPTFRPLATSEVEEYRRRGGLPERFILSVGTLEPRKNLVNLVQAFARIRDGDTVLVIAGGKGWFYEDVFAAVERLGLDDKVVFAGYIPQEELPLLYNAAEVFAYPSIYEGFGLPVVEAQSCGTPVICSNSSSLPEAAGDAAVMVDTRSVEALADGLSQLITDATLRRQLRQHGVKHASQFNWRRTAAQTSQVYRTALSERR
ncbi:MAG: glycosyltransferase family 4 protein [Anaerolineae bacterium]|nr:glycosyltransferase family 4 protein [Anaerolineae bacterium]